MLNIAGISVSSHSAPFVFFEITANFSTFEPKNLRLLVRKHGLSITNMNWVNEGVNEYYEWLKQRTFVKQDDATGWSVISTPYVGIFNDTKNCFFETDFLIRSWLI